MLSPGEKTPKLNDHLLGLMGLGVRGTDSCLDDPSFGELAEGMEIGDNYRLLTLAGEGGCGVVWMAEQLDLYNQRVALKFLRSDAVSRLGHRFDSERRVLSRLHHPGIVAARAVGMTEGGLPYLVMDWVDGVPITLFCDQEKMGIKAQ